VALSPDERTLYVAVFDSTPNRIAAVDTANGSAPTFAEFPDVISVALLPDRGALATNDSAGVVYRVAPGGSPVTDFSTDPALAAAGELSDVLVEPARCGGKLPTLVGTTGRDVLTGTPFADVISTLGGRDRVRGLGGRDIICGGRANDVLIGGAGRDILVGGRGRDHLRGNKGNDLLLGGRNADFIYGGKGRDRLIGGKGHDTCVPGSHGRKIRC
jgi:hypothetical protein